MKYLAIILAELIPRLIDMFMKMQKEKAREAKQIKQIDKEKNRLKGAIDNAYDGTPVTPKQRKEVVDAARDLITDY